MKTLFNVPGVGGEVNVHEAMHASNPTSNAGLTPSTTIDPATGLIDWTRASFRRASFRDASDSRPGRRLEPGELPLRAARSIEVSDPADPTRASFRRASFRRASFRKTADFDK